VLAIRSMTPLLWALPMLLASAFAAPAAAATDDQKRAEIREQSAQALERLYAASPSARGAVESAAGYATFRNFGIRLGVAGGGRGGGLAVDRGSGKEVFMRFVEVQAGVGAGIKKYDLVFVFDTRKALEDFINKGWEYGGQATAAAMVRGEGKAYAGAVSVSPGVWLYQLTSGGLAAEITVKGSKYYKDKSLN
jgi:lipid-binding SYLF domain-containing protein